MFATLIGPYPEIPDASTAEERLTAVLADQLDAGLGMIGDGRVRTVGSDPDAVVEAWRAADAVGHHLAAVRGLEPPLIKACMRVPWGTDGEGEDPVRESVAHVSAAIGALLEAGAPVVQLTAHIPEALDRSGRPGPEPVALLAEALRELAAPWVGLGHLSLAVVGSTASTLPPEHLPEGFASYLFDLVTSPDDWNACARVPGDSGLIAGVVDARAARAGAREVGVWGARYAASMGGRGPARTGICPGAGLEDLDRDAARALLAFTAEVARTADLPDERLAGELDPMAVDARSGALGRGSLRPRRSPRGEDR